MPDITTSRVVVEPKEESAEEVQRFATQSQAALLALIAPHYPERLSPRYAAYANVGVQEEFGVESFIDICAARGIKTLHCLVNSPGGSVVSSFKVARALADYFKSIRMFVPHVAASGGTMIALAGTEIVMGRMSHLSPVDVQVLYKGGRVSTNSIVRAFDRFTKAFEISKLSEEEAPYTFRSMSDKLDPIIMEEMVGENSTCQSYIARILQDAGVDAKLAAQQAEYLTTNFRSHSTVLHRDVLELEGFRVVSETKYRKEWKIMRNWLKSYIGQSGLIHTMMYCLPKPVGGTKTASKGKNEEGAAVAKAAANGAPRRKAQGATK